MTSGRWPTMSLMDPHSNSEINTAQLGDRLDSWKEIARYLNRSVRTLYRWEKDEGLPVHRHQHKELGSVFAFKASSMRGSTREVPMRACRLTIIKQPRPRDPPWLSHSH